MTKIPWYLAGGAEPTFATADGWAFTFDGKSKTMEVSDAKIEACAVFAWNLSPDELSIVNDVLRSGSLIGTRFETWEQFALLNGVST